MSKASEMYYKLRDRKGWSELMDVAPLDQWIPWYRFSLNPIWGHRICIEFCAQVLEAGYMSSATFDRDIVRAYRRLLVSWSTSFTSNKTLTHHLALACLSAVMPGSENAFVKHAEKFLQIYEKLCPDGLWREGTHYSFFVTSRWTGPTIL